MRIAIIASHAWPLPSPARGGDSQILLDLSRSLVELGHDVFLYAPAGTKAAPGVVVREMPLCSMGTAAPKTEECETATLREYLRELLDCDVVHDCSVGKSFHGWALENGRPTIATVWGGPWRCSHPGRNVVAQSKAQRDRLLRGATDFEDSPTPDMGGANGTPLADCRVVWNGINTEAPHGYAPTGKGKQDFCLWLSRWHPARGYRETIAMAKATGLNVLFAGCDPTEDHPYQAQCALEAVSLARGCDNIQIEFLPPDPDHHTRKVELYSDAQALIFTPMFQEPFGLSQVEALACGTPVLPLKRGSVEEVTGYGYDTMEQIAEAAKGLRPYHSDLARERAVGLFDRRVMARKMVALYEEAIEKGWGL
jgi:glycosyltransferase involved in cell wall biosynthesis